MLQQSSNTKSKDKLDIYKRPSTIDLCLNTVNLEIIPEKDKTYIIIYPTCSIFNHDGHLGWLEGHATHLFN